MAEIEVTRAGTGDRGLRFQVRVVEGATVTVHEVSASDADLERLGRGYGSPEELVEASFRFLLAREPKESILRSFDLTTISRYFPEYERGIARSP